ncbi:unnamed protein product, partial [Candidula unifasciata]
TFLYLRFLLVWALVLMADFILEFRFEYLWPFWLLIRSVYDSFKYQGLAFSVFFVCIAITSDVICYLFIPVQWLFFAASTYVWVQYVWHTERGICLPTVSLWLLFVYIEASIRLRELKSLPFNLDLCRPFACHCIGYPVVTLGFGFKSYISYRMRLRRQKVIQKENDFYLQILQQALPAEIQYADSKPKALPSKSEEDVISNGITSPANKKVSSKLDEEKDNSSSAGKTKSSKTGDINEDDEVEFIEKSLPRKTSNVNQFDESTDNYVNEQQTTKGCKVGNSNVTSAFTQLAVPSAPAPSSKPNSKQTNNSKDSGSSNASLNSSLTHSSSSSSSKKGKNMYREIQPSPSSVSYANNKDEVIQRLETDIKKLKADLQASRNSEHELKSQVSISSAEEKAMHSELLQLQQDNENLQNKLHNLVTSRQQDKQTLVSLEKKLTEERKLRTSLELQIANEKKNKCLETARAVAMAAAARGECTDACKARRRDFDNELKQVRRENKMWEEQYRQLEREVQSLRQYKDAQKETEVLMKALSNMQDKNVELENNLCAETRFKQDLFSALGKERNEIKILQITVAEKDNEIVELKSKIAEVMALIPSPAVTSYSHHTNERNSSPLFSSSFSPAHDRNASMQVFNSPDLASTSELNPNASDYTPKSPI